jgi:hypothetical protein
MAGWLPGAASDEPRVRVSVKLLVERLVMPMLPTVCVRPKASPAELATSYSTGAVKFPTVATLNQQALLESRVSAPGDTSIGLPDPSSPPMYL